ncbi:MAG: O-methyltransferase [Gammaproteobacteria bacterium]
MAQIDYNLRPAKHIERVMLAQALRRLSPFGSVESYRYVGFGAAYYRDFRLFHRDLGITNMLSIEQDIANQIRYEFNVPFSCVTTIFGYSTEILPTLDWDVRTILWLDYTGKLGRDMLADAALFVTNCVPGSVLIVTVNVQADQLNQDPLNRLKERVGAENVPQHISTAQLTGWGLSGVCRRIMRNKLDETLVARNGPRDAGARLQFHQLFNFEYADDAKMLTFGGLFCEKGQSALVSNCNFNALPFVRNDAEPCRIEVPKLTYREIHHLQAQFPGDGNHIDRHGIPEPDVDRFRNVYRYFPVFAPTEI